jgi:EmrB/QacA subfamily drug resistance transporter
LPFCLFTFVCELSQENLMNQTEKKPTATLEQEVPHVLLSQNRLYIVTGGILLGSFLAALETTVVGTAMPTVVAALGGIGVYSWVVSAYLLTSTVTVPVWGRLSDLLGRRPLYLAALLIFIVGSALSGAAASITQLIIYRAIQGLGAGGIVPIGMTVIGDVYTLRQRAKVQGFFSLVWGAASILGPFAGGIITEKYSWRWVFYINVPVGLAAAAVIGFSLKEPERTKKPAIDYAGAVWLTLSITLLLILIGEVKDLRFWQNPVFLPALAGAIFMSWLFVRAERKAEEPIMPFSLFRNRVVAYGFITGFLVGTAMFGAITFIPLFVQGTFGGTPTEAGSALTPLLLGWVTFALIGGRLILRIGYRPIVISGLIAVLASFVILARFGEWTPRWALLADIGLMGSGMGLVMLALIISTQYSVERSELGIATSLTQFSRSIGGAVGVAVMGTVLTMGLLSQQDEIQRASGLPAWQVSEIVHNPSALIETTARAQLPPTLLHSMEGALAHALHNVFMVGAVFALLAVIAGFRLPSEWGRPASDSTPPERRTETHVPTSVGECEKLLMAEMTTIDPDHEPDVREISRS